MDEKKENASVQVLLDERQALEEAMAIATETGKPSIVRIGDKKYEITDPEKAGRIATPVTGQTRRE